MGATTSVRDEAAIDAVCLRLSYDALPVRAVSTTLAAAAVAWVLVMGGVAFAALLPWLVPSLLLNAARLALHRWVHATRRTDEELRRALPLHTVLQLAAAGAWGGLLFLTGPSTDLRVVTPILLAIGGMMAAGSHTSSLTPRTMRASVALALLPPTLYLLVAGDAVVRPLLLLVPGHLLTVLGSVKTNNREARDSIALRFENAALVEELRRETEAELAARRDAERANREKSRFLAAASHDARQPLHALGLFVDSLKEQPLDAPARRLVGNIDLAHASLVSLHDGLLDLSALDAGAVPVRLAPVEVGALLRDLQTEAAPRAAQRGLRLDCRAHRLTLQADRALVLRVLRNLVANALAYTREGRVLVTARRRGERALLQVWDTGVGIAPEHQALVFEELYQVGNPERDARRGLGLGLSIVKRLVHALGAEVSVRSTPGRGSVFSFSLPLALPGAAVVDQPGDVGSAPGPRVAKGAVALVVDDDGLAREALAAMLEQWGFEVVSAQGADEALEYAGSLERVDVLIADHWLPGRAGLDLLAQLGQGRPGVARVLVSGDTAPETAERAHAAGVAFLRKPVRAAALREALGARA